MDRPVDRDAFDRWLQAYFAAWVSNEPDDVAALFTEDATYAVGPFAVVGEGRDEIVRWWTSVAQEDVEYAYEVLGAEARPASRTGTSRPGRKASRTAPNGTASC